MKKSRVFLLAFAALVLTLLLAVGIYAAAAPTTLPATESAEGYLQTREDDGETYDLRLVVNANKQWLYHYREAWIDLVFSMPNGGTKSYHGQVDKLFSSALAAGETFKADETCVLFGVVVTDIPYEPLSASATLTLTGDGTENKITLGRIALPKKFVPSYKTMDGPALHKLITGGQDVNVPNYDVASVTFGNWETYAQELAGTDFSEWQSGTEVGVKDDTVRLFRVPRGRNSRGTTYDVYILSKTGRVALPEDSSKMFRYLMSMTVLHAHDLDTSAATNMAAIFEYCTSLTDLTPLTEWDVSNVTSMFHMFYGCSITDLTPLADWDVSSVTNMTRMFTYCDSLADITGLTGWDVSNVTDVLGMFHGCRALTDLEPLAGWDVSNMKRMSEMFSYCTALTDLTPLADWDVSSVTDMSYMFQYCTDLTDLEPLAGWDVSSVTNMSRIFDRCFALTDLEPLASWDVSNVIIMLGMFSKCTSLIDLVPLTEWDVSSVTNMSYMFENCTALTNLAPLTGWNVSSVKDMSLMFKYCDVLVDLTPLADWDVSNVTNMNGMFLNCHALTVADLSGWNTANVMDMDWMFSECLHLKTVYVSDSFVVPSNADNMFGNCTALSGKYWNGSEYVVKTRYQDKGNDAIYNQICSETIDGYLTLKAE